PDAVLDARRALAGVGAAARAPLRVAVVHRSVAVVVEPVAGLGDRANRALAHDHAAAAHLGAAHALAHRAAARAAAAGVALVDRAVAVVVEAVARLGAAARRADAHERA